MNILLFVFFSLTLCAPMIPHLFVSGNLALVDFLFPLLFLISLRLRASIPLPSILLVILTLLSLISMLFNNYRFGSEVEDLFYILRWFYYALMVFSIINIVGEKPAVGKLVLLSVAVSTLISTIVVWSFWLQSPRYFSHIPMLHLVHEGATHVVNRNYFGFFLSVGTPLWLVFALHNNSSPYTLYPMILCIIFLCVTSILTFSKGTWLATFLPIVFLLVMRLLKSKSYVSIIKNVFIFCAITSGVYLLIFTFINTPDNQLGTILFDWVKNSGAKNSERGIFAAESVLIMLNNPIFGVGPGNYIMGAIKYHFIPTHDPHNALLWIGAELGIAGFLIVLSAVVHFGVCILKMYVLNKSQPEIIPELLFVFYISIFVNLPLHGLPFSMKHFWVIYAVAFATYRSRSYAQKFVFIQKPIIG